MVEEHKNIYLNKFLDLVVKQTENMERAFNAFKAEMTTKTEELDRGFNNLKGRITYMEQKLDSISNSINELNSSVTSVVPLGDRMDRLEKSNVYEKEGITFMGKKIILPRWAQLILFMLIGGILATGRLGLLINKIFELF